MLRTIFIVFISFVYGICAQPKLVLSIKNNYDFGLVRLQQSPLKVNIKIFNRGDSILIIKKVKPDCGCTTAPLSKNIINPNDSAILPISLDITSYKGLINKSITIYSNSQPTPITVLTLVANVFRSLDYMSVNYFNFGNPKIGQEYTKEIVIKNKTDKKYIITDIKNPYDYLSTNIYQNQIIKPRGHLKIVIKLNLKKTGPFNFNLFFETNCLDSPELVVSGWGVAIK